jgi:digeranylgeranylglycerophospholipid reductase
VDRFDVVVVGAGPAGGQCARLLSQAGFHVLLAERYKGFEVNSFSSAGAPLEILENYDLPPTVIGSYWDKLKIVTSHRQGLWESAQPQGVVLDFALLREFLAREVTAQGSEVWMGCRYLRHVQQAGETIVTFKRSLDSAIAEPSDPTSASAKFEEISVSTQVLVDATGPSRAVMYPQGQPKPDFFSGTGVEYLIEVPADCYEQNAQTLTFFLGYQWMPKGYSWIFPMSPNLLKVGAGVINGKHEIISHTKPPKYYIELIIKDYLQVQDYKIRDMHGSTLLYSRGLQDIYYQDNVIAIGDAVSTVNFLGGEGIRHAMQGANIAANHIQGYLKAQQKGFAPYQTEMHRVFKAKWLMCERLGVKKYLQDSDELVDRMINYLKPLKLEDVVDILFFYKFEKASKGLLNLLWRKIRSLLLGLK